MTHIANRSNSTAKPLTGWRRPATNNTVPPWQTGVRIMSNNIEGKVVITGASSGLGEATARHLSAHGASIVLGARPSIASRH
jgi:NADPH:quinone reductase-like Zn-dependent oxidoreductase